MGKLQIYLVACIYCMTMSRVAGSQFLCRAFGALTIIGVMILFMPAMLETGKIKYRFYYIVCVGSICSYMVKDVLFLAGIMTVWFFGEALLPLTTALSNIFGKHKSQ